MSDEDILAQADEIEALKSIYYPDEIQVHSSTNGNYKVCIWASPDLGEQYKVLYRNADMVEPAYLKVKHLPPFQLLVRLPKDYPSKRMPLFKIYCKWLQMADIEKLSTELRRLWNEYIHSSIIYTWIEFLKTEALSSIGMNEVLDLIPKPSRNLYDEIESRNSRDASIVEEDEVLKSTDENKPVGSSDGDIASAVISRPIDSIIQVIEAYDREQKKADFLKDFHLCEICFSEKAGKDSILFEKCGHIFCKDCLRNYFTYLINDGNVMGIKCPAYKCDTEASQTQVRELVTDELFRKYDDTLLQTMLDTMSDIVYCPRTFCQYPVTWEPEDRVAVCPSCQYAFCVYCRMGYHGVEPCRFKADERRKLVEEYQQGSEHEKSKLEQRYGKKQLQALVNSTLSEYWIKENSKTCPHCNIVIEKSEGCNKMTCWRCQTCFCWLCGAHLNSAEPYLHFRDPKSPCVNKLFHLLPGEEDDGWGWDDIIEVDSGDSDMEGEMTDSDYE